jgi:HPr kinase/phosphorylase
MTEVTLHATTVAIDGHGVIVFGPPGSGKSDLALRLIDHPGKAFADRAMAARLVADDQTLIRREGGALVASAPPALAGLLEIRGLGIVKLEPAPRAVLSLAVELADAAGIERMPEHLEKDILGVGLALVRIDPAKPSAPARVRAALLSFLESAPAPAR